MPAAATLRVPTQAGGLKAYYQAKIESAELTLITRPRTYDGQKLSETLLMQECDYYERSCSRLKRFGHKAFLHEIPRNCVIVLGNSPAQEAGRRREMIDVNPRVDHSSALSRFSPNLTQCRVKHFV
ncbi:hypothetical protein FRC05_010493 [Tulasnella sp. 425]|nr:hypothetical protein FRC05_010493 [Tulasnella sp. 425]